ncbi:MAG: FkbM family methyltransferase, partial [bacterium]|nr:FkbM family methyltransferase [bacterium]
ERAPEALAGLRRSLAGELKDGRVIVCPAGVWDTERALTLYLDRENAASASFVRRLPGWRPTAPLALTTIDNPVAELSLSRVDLIKMDIEGAEPKALAGAKKTLAKHQPKLAVSAYHADDHSTAIPRAVFEANPSYSILCGFCSETEAGIRPDILFFQ